MSLPTGQHGVVGAYPDLLSGDRAGGTGDPLRKSIYPWRLRTVKAAWHALTAFCSRRA
jgi:hypothetical protein